MTDQTKPKLRLIKVLVQPVFVIDHGDHLSEVDHGIISVPAKEWPTYSGERFASEVSEWQQRIEDDQD